MAKETDVKNVSVVTSDNGSDNVDVGTKNSTVAIRGNVHPLIHERVIKAEHAMKIKDRGVLLDMALRAFFALNPIERANALDVAIEERSKLDSRIVVTERDFNF